MPILTQKLPHARPKVKAQPGTRGQSRRGSSANQSLEHERRDEQQPEDGVELRRHRVGHVGNPARNVRTRPSAFGTDSSTSRTQGLNAPDGPPRSRRCRPPASARRSREGALASERRPERPDARAASCSMSRMLLANSTSATSTPNGTETTSAGPDRACRWTTIGALEHQRAPDQEHRHLAESAVLQRDGPAV